MDSFGKLVGLFTTRSGVSTVYERNSGGFNLEGNLTIEVGKISNQVAIKFNQQVSTETELAQYFEALELSHRAIQHWAALRRTPAEVEAMRAARDAYRKAARSRDPVAMSETNRDFHLVIAAAGRNRCLQSVAYQLSIQGMRLSWIWYDNFATGDPNQDIERTIVEHDLIVDAIEARDAEQAERLAYQHVEAFHRRLIEQLGATLGRAISVAPSKVMEPQDAR